MTPAGILLLALDAEALAVLLWAFFTPSENGQGVFLWLSPGRLLLVALLLLVFLAMLAATIWHYRSRVSEHRLTDRLDRWLIEEGGLAPTLIFLTVIPLALTVGACLVLTLPGEYEVYKLWAPDTFPLLHSLVTILLPALALGVVAALQLALFLAIRYRSVLIAPQTWAWDRLAAALVLLTLVIATAFHWLVLVFQLRFFVNIPGWYWIFDPIPFHVGDVWFGILALGLLAMAAQRIIKGPPAATLLTIAALGWFLQAGVGLMGGGGLATLRDRYFTTYHQAYILKASESTVTVLEGIQRYEDLYGSSPFTSTKPPGLMAAYISLDHLVNGFPSTYDPAMRYARLSSLVIWLFPVMALVLIGLLYAFAGRVLRHSSDLVRRLAPLLVVLAPSFALFTFFPDQALYPAGFLVGVWISIEALRGHSILGAFLLGALLFAAVFFAFTLLPLYAFAGLYLVLHYRRHPPGRRLRGFILSAAAVAAGTLLFYVLGRLLLNYDFVPRFGRTMIINHNFDFYTRVGQELPGGPESLAVRLTQIVQAAWVNNLDFAAAIGFPLYILFIVQGIRRVAAFFQRGSRLHDRSLIAWLGSFLVLNLAGTAQGEVPRLWLFWLPMVALFAAYELEPHMDRHPWLIHALGAAQLVTLMLTFHFQDLRM